MKVQEFYEFMEDANKDFFKDTIEEKALTPLQRLDKDCLDSHIENLIVLTNKLEQLEGKIAAEKSAISNYATENGTIYSDSSFTVSLVFTPTVKWLDEEIMNCDTHISDFEEQIKAIQKKQNIFKEKRTKRIKELQSEIKDECLIQEKSISEIWSEFEFLEIEKESYHIRVDKTTKKTDHERSWIFKKF